MIRYAQAGKFPDKKHTVYHNSSAENMIREELFSSGGFAKTYSTRYHLHTPTGYKQVEELESLSFEDWCDAPLQPFHFTPRDQDQGDFLSARACYFHNDDLRCSLVYPDRNNDMLFRNAAHHELYFIHAGKGHCTSEYGRLEMRPGDYLHIPKGITYQLHFEEPGSSKCLLVESIPAFEIPCHFRSPEGQLLEHAPYSERDFTVPDFIDPVREKKETQVTLLSDERVFRHTLDHHPFDLIGWDGYHYPMTFNVDNYSPITGMLHQPPPVHTVFSNDAFMITNFVPRLLDYHENAIPVPYYHFNCDYDEILYYIQGNFMSRKGIGEGSITLHPMGLAHGPQPGKIEASIGSKEVDELAVMIDARRSVKLTRHAKTHSDPKYLTSWLSD